MDTKVPISAAHETDFAAVQLCKRRKAILRLQKSRTKSRGGRAHTKTPASSAGVVSVRQVGNGRLAGDRLAGNAVDVGAIDTEVLQFARAHAAEFGDGLTVLAPVVEGACYVHDDPLS